MRKFEATYEDKKGVERITISSDGSDLFFTLRGVDFEGHDFEMLSGEVDTTQFDFDIYSDGSGYLTNFKLEVVIPIQLFNAATNELFSENLTVSVGVGETTEIESLDSELNSLKLCAAFGDFSVVKKLEWMEDALVQLQNQLPSHIYLKTCLSCTYSNYSPYGNSMFGNLHCFKKMKEPLKKVKDKSDLLDLWSNEAMENGNIFSVQETFDCSDHEIVSENDWFYKSWTKTL